MCISNENRLTSPGCYTGYAYNDYYEKIGYYNVQTFNCGGELVSLIATWDLSMEVSSQNSNGLKNVRSNLAKSFNLCTTGYNSTDNSISVAQCDANSTYVITKNSKQALVLIGSRNCAYINDILFRRADGGSQNTPTPITKLAGNALGKWLLPTEFITTFSSISDICTEVGNWTYDEGTYYIVSSDEYCKALKTDYAGATYKLYSQFDIRANIGNIPVLGQVVAQYELTIISCQSDNNSHVIKIYIVKNIAN